MVGALMVPAVVAVPVSGCGESDDERSGPRAKRDGAER